jgi:hypothetical protein
MAKEGRQGARLPEALKDNLAALAQDLPLWDGECYLSVTRNWEFLAGKLTEALASDASGAGWGGTWRERFVFGVWTEEELEMARRAAKRRRLTHHRELGEQECHCKRCIREELGEEPELNMPYLELCALAKLVATMIGTAARAGARWLLIETDCLAVKQACSRGWSTSPEMQAMLREFSLLQLVHGVSCFVVWIPGETNVAPDALSRGKPAELAALKPRGGGQYRPHPEPVRELPTRRR